MPRVSAKLDVPSDVLVVGDHPSAYLAAAALRHEAGGKGKSAKAAATPLRVTHAAVPDPQPHTRLVTVNPALFDLHPLTAGMAKPVAATPVFGVRFLADQPPTGSRHRAKREMVGVAPFRRVRDAAAAVAAAAGVEQLAGPVRVDRADETGVDAHVGRRAVRARAVIVANGLPPAAAAVLGVPPAWPSDAVRRFTSIRCKAAKHLLSTDGDEAGGPLMPMSLDLGGRLCWAWLLPGDGEFQLTVEQPLPPATSGPTLLAKWAEVLRGHGVLGPKFTVDPSATWTADLPLAGALAQEGVANRTLLIGPAGGFYSACGEDVYPGCWSALFAADAMRQALKREHLQDALNDYRQSWRTTLGDYLRGPQQNLRLLLPLVYRNPVMTARLAESVLLSKGLVR